MENLPNVQVSEAQRCYGFDKLFYDDDDGSVVVHSYTLSTAFDSFYKLV